MFEHYQIYYTFWLTNYKNNGLINNREKKL